MKNILDSRMMTALGSLKKNWKNWGWNVFKYIQPSASVTKVFIDLHQPPLPQNPIMARAFTERLRPILNAAGSTEAERFYPQGSSLPYVSVYAL